MDGFEKRRNDKKKAIIQAALELFDQYGFDKVTVTEIAKKAHVSKVSIYNFFESKDNLRRIIIKEILDESLAETKALTEKEIPYLDKIGDYMKNRIMYNDRYNMEFFFDSIEGDPVLRKYLDDFSIENKRLISLLIKEGRDTGHFSTYISDDAIELYIDIFHSYFLHNRTVRNTLEQNPGLPEEINLLFLDGLIRGRKE